MNGDAEVVVIERNTGCWMLVKRIELKRAAVGLTYSFSKQLPDISGAVKHTDHFDAILNTTIKDNVVANGRATKLRCKVRPVLPGSWGGRQDLTFVGYRIQKTVCCGGRAVFGDVNPDFEEIDFGLRSVDDLCHQLFVAPAARVPGL